MNIFDNAPLWNAIFESVLSQAGFDISRPHNRRGTEAEFLYHHDGKEFCLSVHEQWYSAAAVWEIYRTFYIKGVFSFHTINLSMFSKDNNGKWVVDPARFESPVLNLDQGMSMKDVEDHMAVILLSLDLNTCRTS